MLRYDDAFPSIQEEERPTQQQHLDRVKQALLEKTPIEDVAADFEALAKLIPSTEKRGLVLPMASHSLRASKSNPKQPKRRASRGTYLSTSLAATSMPKRVSSHTSLHSVIE